MNKDPRLCSQCRAPMKPYTYRMTTLDQCEPCALLFLDSLELNFLTGRNIEQAFFQDPRLITHCTHCKEVLTSPSHCDVLQQQRCADCQSPLYQARIALKVAAQQDNDPYRGDAHSGGPKRYDNVAYDLKVCLQCQGVLLQEDLFNQLLALFSRGKRA